MKRAFMKCIAVALATVLLFSNITFAAYLGEVPEMYIYEPTAEAEIIETLEIFDLPELFLYETELQERPTAEATQTVTLGGVQASISTYLYEESYTYVVLSLDEDPGIFGFAYHLDFDASYWEAVSISLAPNSEARGLFMPTLPPVDGGLIPGRLTFAGFFDDWNDPVTTGVVATVRFRAIGESRNMDAFALGELEIVDEDWNAASIGDGGDTFPALLDAVRIHRYISGLVGLDRSSDFYAVADMDDDGFVCVYDFLLLSQKFAGHDIYFGLHEYSLNLFPDDGEPDYAEIAGFSAAQDIVSFSTGFHTTPMVAAGEHHSIILKSNGTVWGMGQNVGGQLGDGTTTSRLTPVQVSNLDNVIAIAAGNRYNLALRNDGTVWAWGTNLGGNIGDGTTNSRNTPVRVINLDNVIAIAAGERHSIALRNDGTVWAWGGAYGLGLIGDGTTNRRLSPVRVQGLNNVIAISASKTLHSAAVRNDGTVWAWGENWQGQLGDGTFTRRPAPVQVRNLDNAIAIATGNNYTVALRNDGTVWAWGYNRFGHLGDGTTINSNTPVRVQNLDNITAISSGAHHHTALRNDGTVWAWGDNWFGQMGDGTTTRRLIPAQVQNIDNAIAISAGHRHVLVLRNDGYVFGWGFNSSGQLGDGTNTNRLTPVQAVGPDGVGYLNLDSMPVKSISATPEVPNFGTRVLGYSQLTAQEVTVTNTGNVDMVLDALPNIPGWTLTPGANWSQPMPPGATRTFSLRPNTGLAAGTHNPTITVGNSYAQVVVRPVFVVGNIPVITLQPPQNITVLEGQRVDLWAVATGSPAPTIQWQRSRDNGSTWENVLGSTDTMLTYLSVGLNSSGNLYRINATNPFGSVTSGATLLTVNRPPSFNLMRSRLLPQGTTSWTIPNRLAGSSGRMATVQWNSTANVSGTVRAFRQTSSGWVQTAQGNIVARDGTWTFHTSVGSTYEIRFSITNQNLSGTFRYDIFSNN